MNNKITPRGKYILVKKDEEASRESKHGVVMPSSTEQERKAFGTVVAVGELIKDVKKGDRVIYGAYAGEDVEVDERGEKVAYKLVEDEFVIAFLS